MTIFNISNLQLVQLRNGRNWQSRVFGTMAGFTAIEVLVTLVIVGLIAAYSLREISASMVRSKATAETENLRTIEAAKRAFEIANPGKPIGSIQELSSYIKGTEGGSFPQSVYHSSVAVDGKDINIAAMQGWSTQVLTKIAQANFDTYGDQLGSVPAGQSTSYSFEWVNDASVDLGISPLQNHLLDPETGEGYINVLSLSHPVQSTFNGQPGKEPAQGSGANLMANGYNDLAAPGRIFTEAPKLGNPNP